MKITKFMRFLLVAMAALMVFSLFACQGEPETETTTEEIENTTESSDDKKPEDSEKDTDDSESTPVGGDTESTTESTPAEGDSSEEESTSETETSKPECQHVEETVAGKAATCTEAGLTEGKKCSKCGEIIVAQEEIPATGHTIVGPFTYVSNPDGDEALLQGKCENCDETATKPASFQLSVEGIFGGEGVYTFQASETVTPLMGTEMLQFNPEHPKYPADGYTPVPDGSATGFGNLFGVAGWAGYVGSTLEDGAAYKIVDLEGNVLVEWTAVKGVLAEAGLNVTSAADPAITEFLKVNYKDGATDGFRFYHIIDVRDHITVIGGKTVKVIFAFNATAAAENATYIPYATLQINVSDCGHSAATEVAAKAPTCTEAGNDAYKACPTCGKFVLADGTLADAAPVIAATGHTEEVIPAVAPTCEGTGLTEGKKCSVCDEILTAQTEVAAAGHKMVDVAAKDPTMTEKGWEAYKTCENCDQLFDAEGNKIDDIPYIDALSNMEIYYDANALLGLNFNKKSDLATVTLKDDDGTYVRYERLKKFNDGTLTLIATDPVNTKVTGQYIIFKYRTDHMTSGHFWADDTPEVNGNENFIATYNTDGQWHIMIYDLAAKKPATVHPNENGEYVLKWCRIDLLDTDADAGYFDLAWVGFCDDLADASAIITSDADKAICPHSYVANADCKKACEICGIVTEEVLHNNVERYTDEGNVRTYESGCATCGEGYITYTVTFGDTKPEMFVAPAAMLAQVGKSAVAARFAEASVKVEDGIGYLHLVGAEKGEAYFDVFPTNNKTLTGQYVLIKYRASTDHVPQFNIFTGAKTTDGTATTEAGSGANFYIYATSGASDRNSALINDGEWQYMFIDLAAICKSSGKFEPNADGTYTITHFRFDVIDTGKGTIDLAYVAFADSFAELAAMDNWLANNKANCTHIVDGWTDSVTGNNDYAQVKATCKLCGEAVSKAKPVVTHPSTIVGATDVATGYQGGTPGVITQDAAVLGVAPKADCTLGLKVWTVFEGYHNSAAFRVLDADGKVLQDWTAATGAMQGTPTDAAAIMGVSAVKTTVPGAKEDMVRRFDPMIAQLKAFENQTVTVQFALVWDDAPEGASEYVLIYVLKNVAVPTFVCPHENCTEYEAKEATCTETGNAYYKVCTCGTILDAEGEVLDAIPTIPVTHAPEVLAAVAATCTTTGLTEGSKCSKCGAILVAQEEIEALGHTEETVAGKAATCTEAGITDGKKCSVCGETLVAQEEIAALGHTEETVAGKAATCTETGLTEGKKCSVCGETLVAQEEIAKLAHTEETVAGKDANCEENGLTEGKKCSVCGEVLVAQEVIPANGHTKVEHAYIAPTTAETGCEKYSSCENCDKLWNADGEEIDEIPTIAVIVPTTEVYLGAAELADKSLGGSTGAAPIVSADRTYTNFARTKVGTDGNIMLLEGNTAVTGNYLVFKYRTDNQPEIQIWANTLANGHDGGKASFYYQLTTGEGWHIAIIDLSVSLSKYVIADAEGNYTIQWARMDILDGEGDSGSGYIDIAYIGICDDPADIVGIMQEGDKDLCTHVVAKNPVYTNLGDNHSTECAVCGETMIFNHQATTAPVWNTETLVYSCSCICGKEFESNAIYVSEPYSAGAKNDATIEVMDGFVRYTKTGTGDPYIHVYANGTAITGQYAIIKYRASKAGLSYNNSFVGSAAGTHKNTASAGCDSNRSSTASGSFAYDGENWQYVIIEAKSQCFVANDDGSYTFGFLRLGFGNLAVNDYLDVDEIAFVDNLYAAERYVYGEDAVCKHGSTKQEWISETETVKTSCLECGVVISDAACTHSSAPSYIWDAEAKLYTVTCPLCGTTLTKDMLYKTEGTLASGDVQSSVGFLTATQEDGFIRYTPTKAAGDPFFYPVRNVTSVTGQYMVIKYRLTNNGANITASAPYASSAASGQTGAVGKNGDGSNYLVNGATLYADGQWHYLIVTPNLNINKTFTPNADGTYSWNYFRIRLGNGFAANDGTCYIDIDEIAFADNIYAADRYMKGDAAVCEHVSSSSYVWDNVNGYTISCDLCGHTTVSDMIYKTEANTGALSNHPGTPDAIKATTEDGVVRYTFYEKPSDGYFNVFAGNTKNVTGKYMVIKYRLENKGENLTVTSPFAGTAPTGRNSASGSGDQHNDFVNGATLYADGEWHYLIVTPKAENTFFVANANGTYTWTYLRMTINNFAAYDGSCYFEVDEIAFADDMEAVNQYANIAE